MTTVADTRGPCRLEVWNAANDTKLADLPYVGTADVDDVMSDTGLLTATVGLDEAAADHLDEGNHVRAYIGDACIFTGLIEEGVERVDLAVAGADEVATLRLRGHIAAWAKPTVKPYGGLDAKPQSQDRPHKWSSPETDISSWSAAVVRFSSLSEPWDSPQTDPPWYTPWLPPVGFYDTTASWLWSRTFDGSTPDPVGESLFATDVVIPDDGLYEIQFAADDGGSVEVDGIEVLRGANNPADSFIRAHAATLELTAGTHRIGIRGENYERPETAQVGTFGGPNVGRVALAIYSRVAEGANQILTADDLVAHTDSTWKCLDYPETWPAPTDGQIIRIHLEEAQADGALTGASLAFDDDVDSAGNPWAENGAVSFQVDDDTPLSVLQSLANAGRIDWWYDPESLTLYAWNAGGKGAPHAASYAEGSGLLGMTSTTLPIVNSLQVRWRGGRFLLEDATSITANGLHRRTLKLADLDESAARAVAQRYLDANKDPRSSRTVAIELGPDAVGGSSAPYGAGGWVTGDSPTFDGEQLLVHRIRTTFGVDGWPTWVPEVENRKQEDAERQEIALSKASAGTLGGRLRAATPAEGIGRDIVAGQAKRSATITFTQVVLTPTGMEAVYDKSSPRTWEDTVLVQRIRIKQEHPPESVDTKVVIYRTGPGGTHEVGTVTLPVGFYRGEVVQGETDLPAYSYVSELEGIFAVWEEHDPSTGDPEADSRWCTVDVIATPAHPADVDPPSVDVPWE